MIPQRISWIDVARGIGIILVIYAHELSADSYRYLLYAFHMPLFFFLSGIVFHVKKDESFLTLVKKSTKSILFPYFLFAILSYGLWFIDVRLNVTINELLRQFYGILYGNSNNGFLVFNNVLWFLPCLFVVKIVFGVFTKITTRKTNIALFLFIFSVIGFISSFYFSNIKLPLSAETALTAVVFFGLGFLWSNQSEKFISFFQKKAWIIFFVLLVLYIFFAQENYNLYGLQIDMRMNRLNNYFFFYLAAMSGILSVIAGSMLINKNHLLEYIGKNSLILFVWHLIVFSYFNRILKMFIDAETINSIRVMYLSPIYTVFSIVVILSFAILIRKIKR